MLMDYIHRPVSFYRSRRFEDWLCLQLIGFTPLHPPEDGDSQSPKRCDLGHRTAEVGTALRGLENLRIVEQIM
jgi:hypothetical protein